MSAQPGFGKITDAKIRELRHYDKTIINRDGNIMTQLLMTNCISATPPNPLVIKGNVIFESTPVQMDTLVANVVLVNETLVAGNNLVVGGPALFFGNVGIMENMFVGKDMGVGGELVVEQILRDETAKRLFQLYHDASVSLYIDDNGNASVCSGSFISPDGYIMTAAHCCSPNNSANVFANIYALVTNYDNTSTSRVVGCNFIGMDGAGDIGILKVDGLTNQTYLQWGSSIDTSIGDRCFIIGNPLGIDHQSISDGLIRDAMYVQTTPPVYVLESLWTEAPGYGGSSGSPILNLNGNIVGLYTFGEDQFENLGGGPTQRMVQPVVQKIIDTQNDYYLFRGQLGIFTKPLTLPDAAGTILMTGGFNFRGVIIFDIKPGSAAETAGLLINDIIVAVDGTTCGILDGQTSHTTPYWHKAAGSLVEIQYVRPMLSLNPVTVMVTLDPADLDTDFPFSGWS